MKTSKIITIFLFCAVILLPLAFFNTEVDSISSIDNRKLAGNPLKAEGSITENIDQFIDDRIGFRSEMIESYTILNDRIFNKMVHPSYSYGKDDYIFGSGITTGGEFEEFHLVFADMIEDIQNYCENRDVPFLFVFNPAKPAIYQDKIQEGINYNRDWVDSFFKELKKRNINYLDNKKPMVDLRDAGVKGFNTQFDPNHWNDIGAFHGTNEILKSLSEEVNHIHINDFEEFTVSKQFKTHLPDTLFPIEEEITILYPGNETNILTEEYSSELELDSIYKTFGYLINESENLENTPRLLSFQGSYMNSYGYKFLNNAFREYIFVHDYQNIINFPYYFNIFQPEVVIFEVAEYTVLDRYFNFDKMKAIDYNPALSTLREEEYEIIEVSADDFYIENGNTLSKIQWKTDVSNAYVWILLDEIYDMQEIKGGYEVIIEKSRLEESDEPFELYLQEK